MTNPDSNVNIRGFITDSSYYKVRVDVDLPLYGRSVNFLARDTFGIDFSNFQKMYKAEFKLVTVNSLPLDVSIQGYFIDKDGAVLDEQSYVSDKQGHFHFEFDTRNQAPGLYTLTITSHCLETHRSICSFNSETMIFELVSPQE